MKEKKFEYSVERSLKLNAKEMVIYSLVLLVGATILPFAFKLGHAELGTGAGIVTAIGLGGVIKTAKDAKKNNERKSRLMKVLSGEATYENAQKEILIATLKNRNKENTSDRSL